MLVLNGKACKHVDERISWISQKNLKLNQSSFGLSMTLWRLRVWGWQQYCTILVLYGKAHIYVDERTFMNIERKKLKTKIGIVCTYCETLKVEGFEVGTALNMVFSVTNFNCLAQY